MSLSKPLPRKINSRIALCRLKYQNPYNNNKLIRLYSVFYKKKPGITYPALVQETIASGGMGWLDITLNTVRFEDNFKTTKISKKTFERIWMSHVTPTIITRTWSLYLISSVSALYVFCTRFVRYKRYPYQCNLQYFNKFRRVSTLSDNNTSISHHTEPIHNTKHHRYTHRGQSCNSLVK